MHRTSGRILLIVAAFALFLVPVAAIAAGGFTDVEDGSVFEGDIQWLADAGVTKGCNPPTNDKFCPEDNVTREQMAAFMHRLAANQVVDADKVDGKDSTAFATSGHNHDTAYLAKTAKAADADKLDGRDSTAFLDLTHYDTDANGVVDSAEVKIRYADEGAYVDMAEPDANRMVCVTASMTFARTTTVVGSGGLSLDPLGTYTSNMFGRLHYNKNRGGTWTVLNGVGIEDSPSSGTQDGAMPINAVNTLGAGSYTFAILPVAIDYQTGNDYYAYCELAITAYVGQGPTTDVVLTPLGVTTEEKDAGS